MPSLDDFLYELAERLADLEERETLSDQDPDAKIQRALEDDRFRLALFADDDKKVSVSPRSDRASSLLKFRKESLPVGDSYNQLLTVITSRVVTLFGESGSGKTRLAIRYGHDQGHLYAGGVWFVRCSPDVPLERAILALMSDDPSDWIHGRIDDRLGVEKHLLILDDFNHTPESVEILRRVHEKCPNVKELTTPRQRLGIDGEVVLELGQEVEESGVGFLQQLARPWRKSNALRLLGRRLAGAPLALSLAAGCLANTTPDQLLTEIDRSGISVQGTGHVERLLALAASQLSEAERASAANLTVFRGPFSLSDASEVLSVDAGQFLRALGEKGLIEESVQADGERYFFHDSVRRYFESEPVDGPTQLRYVSLFSNRAAQVGLLLEFGDWTGGMAHMMANWRELRHAIRLGASSGAEREVKNIAICLNRPLFEAGMLQEFDEVTGLANTLDSLNQDAALQIELLGLQGARASRDEDLNKSEELWLGRLNWAEKAGDPFAAIDTLNDLAYLCYEKGRFQEGLAYLVRAEEALKVHPNPDLMATMLVIRARCNEQLGNLDVALVNLSLAESELERCEDKSLSLFVIQSLAVLYDELGNPERGRGLVVQLLSEASQGDFRVLTGWSLGMLARLYESQGRLEEAARAFTAAKLVFDPYPSKYQNRSRTRLSEFQERNPDMRTTVQAELKGDWRSITAAILTAESGKN